jgi:predicted outer membrane lipoprotein
MAGARVSAAKLYAILDREFRLLRPPACTVCRIPLPYWQAAPDEVSANWIFGTPVACAHGCHVIMAELLAQLWTAYELEEPRASKRLT